MSNLEPRGGRRLSRGARTDRAFNYLVISGVSGVAAVVMLFVSGFGLFLLLALVAAAFGYLFKRTVS
ncbi:MAG TPA: hypothetical protein VFZ89_12540 [Solirubrobacteraceae bacterium]